MFQPEGAEKTLAEVTCVDSLALEETPDSCRARAQAVENFVKDIPFAIVNPIFDWTGTYQE